MCRSKMLDGWGPKLAFEKSIFDAGQALKLVDTMRNDPNVDFANDWKVITVFIGGNDACDYFDGEKEENSPDKYIEGVRK